VGIRISITLPSELLAQLDQVDKNRSGLLERARKTARRACETRSAIAATLRSSIAMLAV